MFIGKSLSKTHSALCARCSTAVRRAVLSRRRASRQQAGWLLKLRGHSPSPSAPAAPCALAWRHREGLQLPWTHRTYPNQHQSPSASAHKTNRARGAGKLGEKGGRDGNGERDGQSWGINCRGCNTNEWPQNLWSVFSLCCCSFFFFMFLMLVLFFSPEQPVTWPPESHLAPGEQLPARTPRLISAGEIPVAVAMQETLIVLHVYKQPLQISLPSLSPEVICIVINS